MKEEWIFYGASRKGKKVGWGIKRGDGTVFQKRFKTSIGFIECRIGGGKAGEFEQAVFY